MFAKMWAEMEKENKGQGKGGCADHGHQHGAKGRKGGRKGQGKGQPGQGDLCRCCGKPGHTKSNCRHREKTCDNCGKVGHLKGVCTATPKVDAAQKSSPAGAAPAVTGDTTIIVPWSCMKCYHRNLDHKLMKCEKCHAAKAAPPKNEEAPDVGPKPLINKTLLQKMDAGGSTQAAAASTEMDDAERQVRIERLEKFIETAKQLGMATEEPEAELKTLRRSEPAAGSLELTSAADGKEAAAEKVKLIKQWTARKGTLESQAEEATTAKKRHAEQKLKMIKEEEERHRLNLEKLEQEFTYFDKVEAKKIEDVNEKLTKEGAHYEQEIQKLNGFINANQQGQHQTEHQQEAAKEEEVFELEADEIQKQLNLQGITSGCEETSQKIAEVVAEMWAKKMKEHKEKQEKEDMEIDLQGGPMRTVTGRRRQNLAAGSFIPTLTGGKRSEPEEGKPTTEQVKKSQMIDVEQKEN